MSSRFRRARNAAFSAQGGLCFYCSLPMWLEGREDFSKQHFLTLRQSSRYQCTAEHLVARREGGGHRKSNIVAACRFCNQTRHRASSPLTPDRYKEHVGLRMEIGRWQPQELRPRT